MLIVVEGIDSSGKSTLVNSLRKNPHEIYTICIQASRPWGLIDLRSYIPVLLQLELETTPSIVICDRYHPISEAVYGPLLRGSVFDHSLWGYYLDGIDLIVYCRPPIETIRAHLAKNPQMTGVAEHLESLLGSYDRLMSGLQDFVDVVRYDPFAQPIELIYERVFR